MTRRAIFANDVKREIADIDGFNGSASGWNLVSRSLLATLRLPHAPVVAFVQRMPQSHPISIFMHGPASQGRASIPAEERICAAPYYGRECLPSEGRYYHISHDAKEYPSDTGLSSSDYFYRVPDYAKEHPSHTGLPSRSYFLPHSQYYPRTRYQTVTFKSHPPQESIEKVKVGFTALRHTITNTFYTDINGQPVRNVPVEVLQVISDNDDDVGANDSPREIPFSPTRPKRKGSVCCSAAEKEC